VQIINAKINLITKTSFVKTQNNMKVQKKVNKLKKKQNNNKHMICFQYKNKGQSR